MILASDLIRYMRANRSGGDDSAWRVDYASTLLGATDKSKLPLPCLYAELNTTTAINESEGDYLQLFTTNIRVRLVCKLVDNDRNGRTGADTAYWARRELFKILLDKKINNWKYNPIYFVGDQFEAIDEARYFHVFDFAFTGAIDPSDTEQPDFGPLNSLHIDYDLTESAPEELPNAQDVLNTFQD